MLTCSIRNGGRGHEFALKLWTVGIKVLNHPWIIKYILYFKTSLKKHVSKKNIEYTNTPISTIAWLLGNRDKLVYVNDHILYVTLRTIKLEQSKWQTMYREHEIFVWGKSGQASFDIMFSLLSNKQPHFPSNIWICCCMPNMLCHLIVTVVMFKWYELLHYKEIIAIYWMTLVCQQVTHNKIICEGKPVRLLYLTLIWRQN